MCYNLPMQIWTTPELNELLLEKDFPVRLQPEEEIKDAFLINSRPGDIAVIGLDPEAQEFLEAVAARDHAGQVIFISPEPTAVLRSVSSVNSAVVLDLKTLGAGGAKDIISFIINLAMNRQGVREVPFELEEKHGIDEKPLEDPEKIREVLTYLAKRDRPVVVAFEIKENGESIMARGGCTIKEAQSDTTTLHRFRQSLFMKGLKPGISVKIFFSHKYDNMEATAVIRQARDKEIQIAIPERLFPTKDIRIQPNLKRPIGLFVLIPNEPTTNYRVIDISPRGIGFVCPRDLPEGGIYAFTIMLPEPEAVVITRGIIRHKKELHSGYRYGAEILPHPWDEDAIAKYVMKRELEIISHLRDL